jgi:REP element-mobilizing transposase RayT
MNFPMAFHITWGTYGPRLHGSSKPHVDRDHNEYGTPFAPTDPEREHDARERMRINPVSLDLAQRKIVEAAIHEVADRYAWTVHAIAIQSNHEHVVITAMREGIPLREALKAVASRALNKAFERNRWWAEGRSAKYLWERDYFLNAVDYVRRQRDF